MDMPWRRRVEAGRTAGAHYERLLRAWRRQIRTQLVIVGISAGFLALPIGLLAPHGEFFAGAWIGAIWGVLMWIFDEPPEYIAKWKRGAEGERRTWKALRRLERGGWRSFHDRDGSRGNLDHIVVGPAGVFLLESKNLSGRVCLEPEGLTTRRDESPRDAFTNTSLGRSMRGAAVGLKKRLEQETGIRPWV